MLPTVTAVLPTPSTLPTCFARQPVTATATAPERQPMVVLGTPNRHPEASLFTARSVGMLGGAPAELVGKRFGVQSMLQSNMRAGPTYMKQANPVGWSASA